MYSRDGVITYETLPSWGELRLSYFPSGMDVGVVDRSQFPDSSSRRSHCLPAYLLNKYIKTEVPSGLIYCDTWRRSRQHSRQQTWGLCGWFISEQLCDAKCVSNCVSKSYVHTDNCRFVAPTSRMANNSSQSICNGYRFVKVKFHAPFLCALLKLLVGHVSRAHTLLVCDCYCMHTQLRRKGEV